MKARIQNGIVVEFLSAIPGHSIEECFHPSILAGCVDYVEGMLIGEPIPEIVVEAVEEAPEAPEAPEASEEPNP